MRLRFPTADPRIDALVQVSEQQITVVPVADVVKFGADPTGQRSSVDAINEAMDTLRTLHYMSRDDA